MVFFQNRVLSPNTINRASRQSASKRVNDLLAGTYSPEYMASHCLTGQASDAGKQARDAMDPEAVQEIISKYHMHTSEYKLAPAPGI